NSGGNLVTHSGDPLLGKKGPIKVPPGEIVIDSAGKISVNVIDSAGKISVNNVDTLRLDQIPKGENTAKVGDLYWTVPENPTRARETTVHQGLLEKSNVNPSLDMVELIKVTREYEQMQKAIKAMDEMASQAIQAGRVQG
ncbi:MAG: flagellar basal body rod C-terminal domain-containing protein, partial [Nitrospirota bacterium]